MYVASFHIPVFSHVGPALQPRVHRLAMSSFFAAVFPIYLAGLTKPLPERYIHSYITTSDGGICILTCVPYLLKLLDDPGVTSFDDDTTYKRLGGKMNEWELSIFAKIVQRAASLVRAYINRGSADFFELIFDELQRVKLMVTGKPIAFKKFVPGGNLLVMNSDMDAAQIIGACRSVMKHNVPAHSGIPDGTPVEKVAPHFVKICWRHAKEPVHDFRALVNAADFARLTNFTYIESDETLAAFSAFVYGLGKKEITNWWAHKEMNAWIIPCLIKSQSLLSADVWDITPSTTNTNEAQHAWTNAQTGIRLSVVEALKSAQAVDEKVAEEIQMSIRTGIMANPNNEIVHRLARNGQRLSASARKTRESRQATELSKDLQIRLDTETEKRRESTALTKALKEQLKASKQASKSGSSTILSASSSGRVKMAPARSAVPAPVCSMQSENATLYPGAVHRAELLSGFTPPRQAAEFASYDLFTFGALTGVPAPEIANTPTIAPTDFSGIDFSTFDIDAFFGLDPNFNTLIPSGPPAEYLQQDYMHSFAPSVPADLEYLDNLPSPSMALALNPVPFLLLPPPPPESPPASSPPMENLLEPGPSAPKPRRSRKEVDPANIITSSRSRAPTARKRMAAEMITSDRSEKRAKAKA
ncbi:hypothetical protein B0H17DRAFT_640822 [Mycena rosella]|uniref:Uncharacterized protein n=1 Tax=Mycena rosella TaxID=1033263 RepID=A0AAD7GHJ2_MYCRO|nr:hypothetical protein B0H17DRAFT_640822 [Mycena rosella]